MTQLHIPWKCALHEPEQLQQPRRATPTYYFFVGMNMAKNNTFNTGPQTLMLERKGIFGGNSEFLSPKIGAAFFPARLRARPPPGSRRH